MTKPKESHQRHEPTAMADPRGLLWFGDFAIPAEVAYRLKPSDPPYPMFFMPSIEEMWAHMPRSAETSDAGAPLRLGPGYGPPYDPTPQDTTTTSDAVTPAPSEPDETSAENDGSANSGEQSGKS